MEVMTIAYEGGAVKAKVSSIAIPGARRWSARALPRTRATPTRRTSSHAIGSSRTFKACDDPQNPNIFVAQKKEEEVEVTDVREHQARTVKQDGNPSTHTARWIGAPDYRPDVLSPGGRVRSEEQRNETAAPGRQGGSNMSAKGVNSAT